MKGWFDRSEEGGASARRDEAKVPPAPEPIHEEVGVQREDHPLTKLLGESHESRIGEVHGAVRVLAHQPSTAAARRLGEVGEC